MTLYGKRIYGVTDEIKDNLWTIGHTSLNLAKRLNLPTGEYMIGYTSLNLFIDEYMIVLYLVSLFISI